MGRATKFLMIGYYLVTTPKRTDRDLDYYKKEIPSIQVIDDVENLGVLGNHIKALEAAQADGIDWAIFLQDDLIFCKNFMVISEERTAEAGKLDIDCFQFFRGMVGKMPENERWVKMPYFLWAQATAFHHFYLKKLVKFLRDEADQPNTYDGNVRVFNTKRKIFCYSTVPHYVNHNLKLESTLGTGKAIFGRQRDSTWFVDDL